MKRTRLFDHSDNIITTHHSDRHRKSQEQRHRYDYYVLSKKNRRKSWVFSPVQQPINPMPYFALLFDRFPKMPMCALRSFVRLSSRKNGSSAESQKRRALLSFKPSDELLACFRGETKQPPGKMNSQGVSSFPSRKKNASRHRSPKRKKKRKKIKKK